MKKIMMFTLVIFFLPFLFGYAIGSPFLVCDPQPGVETYDVELDGVIIA